LSLDPLALWGLQSRHPARCFFVLFLL